MLGISPTGGVYVCIFDAHIMAILQTSSYSFGRSGIEKKE